MAAAPYRLDTSRAMLEPCPCDGCRFAERCKVMRLACQAFAMFMNGEPLWERAPRIATRARYAAIIGDP